MIDIDDLKPISPLNNSSSHFAPVNLSTAAEAWNLDHAFQHRNIGEEIERISQKQWLCIWDCVHNWQISKCLRLLLDYSDVTDCQTIEKVHENNHDQDNKREEVEIAERHQSALQINRNVRELELSNEHGAGLDECKEGVVEESLKSVIIITIFL